MVEKIEVYQAPDGWRWRAIAGNGEVVAQGEAYTRKDDALEAVEADDIQTVREVLWNHATRKAQEPLRDDALAALDRIEAVVKAAWEYRSTNPTVPKAAALDEALAALDPTEAPR